MINLILLANKTALEIIAFKSLVATTKTLVRARNKIHANRALLLHFLLTYFLDVASA